jgi:peptidyl-prolyl cis-trans isomerase B (cyclophilin B)
VKNFLAYVESGHYDNTIFHRVIDGFMIQGGGFEPGMNQKPTNAPIQNEAHQRPEERPLHHRHGAHRRPAFGHRAVLHQRQGQRLPQPHKCQRPGWGYCVFGKVVEGMDVVDKIKGVKTGNKGFHQDVPREDVIIERAEKA